MSKYRIDKTRKQDYCLRHTGERVEVYQIQALIDIPLHGVKKGDFGGFVEDESNLSQEGSAWIFDGSMVLNDSFVAGNAVVKGVSILCRGSRLFDEASINNTTMENSFIAGFCKAQNSGMENACFY